MRGILIFSFLTLGCGEMEIPRDAGDAGPPPRHDAGRDRDAGPSPGIDANLPDGAVPDYCNGRVAHRDPVGGSVPPLPPVGEWIDDRLFGTQIMRLTDVGEGAAATPVYSTVPAWNADGSLLILYSWGQGHAVIETAGPSVLGPLQCDTADGWHPAPSDLEHVMWDPDDPDFVYFPSRYAPGSLGAQPNLYRCNVRTHEATIARNFSTPPTSCVAGQDDLTMGRDPQWYPGNLVGLDCGYYAGDAFVGRKWIYDIAEDRVYMPRSGPPFADSTAPIAAPSGTLAYHAGQVYDLDLNPLRSLGLANPYEHANIGRGADGHDYYFAVDFDGADPGVIIAYDLQTAESIPLISESTGWGYPPGGVHLTSVSPDLRATGWVLASIVGDGSQTFSNEFVLANVDTRATCRVGRHWSRAGEGGFGYQGEPHPVFHILPDGTLEAVFASDWGGGNRVNTYLLRVPPG